MPDSSMPWTDEEDDMEGAVTASSPHPTPQKKPPVPASESSVPHPYGDNKYSAGSGEVLNRLGADKSYGQ